jgi:hypothetical protein
VVQVVHDFQQPQLQGLHDEHLLFQLLLLLFLHTHEEQEQQ